MGSALPPHHAWVAVAADEKTLYRSGTPRGTGFGLAIVGRVVEEHRGDITFRVSPRGTAAEVRLPLLGVLVAA